MEQKIENQVGHIDWFIFLPVVGLLLFSMVFVYSASAPTSVEKFGSVDKLFINQVIRVAFSLIILIIFSKIDYHIYKKIAKPIILVAVASLVLVLIIGDELKGARRWLSFGPLSIQPVEYAKFAIVIYFSYLLVEKQKVIKTFYEGFLPFIFWIAIICVLIALQPNFSNMFLVFIIAMTMMFVGNTNLLHLMATAFVGIIGAGMYAVAAPYRMARILTYFGIGNTSLNITNTKYQLQQALIALGNGGFLGLGPGQSKQSHLFLPESYGDFIFSTIGEEYGFLGLLLIFAAFGLIFFRGMIVAKKAPDVFGYFLAIGIILTLAIYLFTNAAVNTGLLPTTGVPLPFLSYGGTAVLIYSAVIGILLNISAQANVYTINKNPVMSKKSNEITNN